MADVALTATQQQLLQRVARGDTIAAAATAVGVSFRGAEEALARARRALGARSLTHAVVLAAEGRLLTGPPKTRHRPLTEEQRADIEAAYPSTRMGEREWVDVFDARPDVYHRLLAAIGRAPRP